VRRLACTFLLGLLFATSSRSASGSKPDFVADLTVMTCNADADQLPGVFETSAPLDGLFGRKERRIQSASITMSGGLAHIRIASTSGHHYIDIRTDHCATDIPILGSDGETIFYSGALVRDYVELDWPQDAWVTGCAPFPGLTSVELRSPADPEQVEFVGRLSGSCYYFGPIGLRKYILTATLSDGRRTEGVVADARLDRHLVLNLSAEQIRRLSSP
jgi:hypothetical protein